MKRFMITLLWCAPVFAANLGTLRADEVAYWIAPVQGKGVLAAHRADASMNPASTMKLLTTWAALQQMGPGYRWRSELKSSAPIVNGVLKGDLYWLGRGDPRLDSARLAELQRQLRLRGVSGIEGHLVLDKQAFSRISSAEGFDHDAGRAFSVAPDTHLTNLKVAWLRYYYEQGRPQLALDPPLSGFTLDNQLQSSADTRCADVRSYANVQISGQRIRVTGRLPAACDGQSSYLNLLAQDDFAVQSFRALWQENGGSGALPLLLGGVPATARTLAQLESDSLVQAISDINKASNNTMARNLWLTLGVESPQSGDTVKDAELAVRRALRDSGISDTGLQLENGAGLSRRERIRASTLGEMLQTAARGPYAAEFISSLPIASVDGTLRRRFVDIGPRLRLKTGTLDDVRALAGYWQAPDGRQLVLVMLINSPRAAELQGAMDKLLAELLSNHAASLGISP